MYTSGEKQGTTGDNYTEEVQYTYQYPYTDGESHLLSGSPKPMSVRSHHSVNLSSLSHGECTRHRRILSSLSKENRLPYLKNIGHFEVQFKIIFNM